MLVTKRYLHSCRNGWLWLSLFILYHLPAQAGLFDAFGPQTFVRQTGAPSAVTTAFRIKNPNTLYNLQLTSGVVAGGDLRAASSAVVLLNGVRVFDRVHFYRNDDLDDVHDDEFEDLDDNLLVLERSVILKTDNVLSVKVRGRRGAGLTVRIIGVDNDLPLITARIDPVANSLGWHNQPPTINFTCDDITSAISQCSQAVIAGQQGAQRLFTGTAVDSAGNSATTSVVVNLDQTAPVISAQATTSPNGVGWYNHDVTVTFSCHDELSGILSCQAPATIASEDQGQLVSGVAVDRANNSAQSALLLNIDKTAPVISLSGPLDGATVSEPLQTLTGQIFDDNAIASVTVNGHPVTMNGDAAFSYPLRLQVGINPITVSATDIAGNLSTMQLSMTLADPLPADPATVAPPVNTTSMPSMLDSVSFLFTGSDPIQSGVNSGIIDAGRVAVLRGQVQSRDGMALGGVEISVHGHPEFGRTLTRRDGMFDLAVNGGGRLIIDYHKDGYLDVQRSIESPWRDYAWLPDVVLLQPDSLVSSVDLPSAALQRAQGSIIRDGDGERRLTVMFPAGTTATMVMADGSSSPLPTLHVRATEATVGVHGQQSMPAELPPASGYTYAVDINADEAVAAGAASVQFSNPLPVYVENFLGFPVGERVPVGHYDLQQAAWIAADNGRIVKILASDAAGRAELDLDGSGIAADSGALAAFGISDDERIQLMTLYPVGQTLWRVSIRHFSSWDFNWPWGVNTAGWGDEIYPNPKATTNLSDKRNQPCLSAGSVIACQNQTLGEVEPVTGTPFTLHYHSDRVPGRSDAATLQIPLTGSVIHPDLMEINVNVEVAGRRFDYSTSDLTANRYYTLTWDGRDGYGRRVQGSQRATVTIAYVYRAVYFRSASDLQRSFDRYPADATVIRRGGGAVDSARVVTIARTAYFNLGILGDWDATLQGLGGWTLDVQHAYDPIRRKLILGDGRQRDAAELPWVIHTIAGSGVAGNGGDGGAALMAQFNRPFIVRTAADGSVYVVDNDVVGANNHRVRRMRPDGTVTTLLRDGNIYDVQLDGDGRIYWISGGSPSYRIKRREASGTITVIAGGGSVLGDNGPATSALLDRANSLALAADGSVYISDGGNKRIRKVTTDGIIYTVAGGGTQTPYYNTVDGARATGLLLYGPGNVATANDGGFYFTNSDPYLLLHVDNTGRTRRIAGQSGKQYAEAGVNVKNVNIPAMSDLAQTASGELVFADETYDRILRIDSNGILRVVAGKGTSWYGDPGGFSGDNGPAPDAQIDTPASISFDNDGMLYIADLANHRLRRVGIALPGYDGDGHHLLAAEDGHEVYEFDASGRQLRTINALTGADLYRFGYDGAGYLERISDGDGNITRIERSGATPYAIVAADGQRTMLSVDVNGYLASISNPAGERVSYQYTPDGLLTMRTDARNNSSTMGYDQYGRLGSDSNAAGGGWSLVRSTLSDGYVVDKRSALGRTTRYVERNLSDGSHRSVITAPDTTQTVTLVTVNGTRTTTMANGSLATAVYSADPRFGMQSPVARSTTLKMPSGLLHSAAEQRSANYDYLGNLTALTNTMNINGRVSASRYDVNAALLTTTTAAGRANVVTVDGQGRPLRSRYADLATRQYSYDWRGRLTRISDDNGARSSGFSYGPDGNLHLVTDPLDRITRYEYDVAGRISRQILPDGRELQFNYDGNGNMIALVTPSGAVHRFRYDAVDQADSYTPPLLPGSDPATYYNMNLDGQLELVTRPDGRQLDDVYDNAGRLSQQIAGTGVIDYAYHSKTGQLVTITATEGLDTATLSYSYDGRLPVSESMTGPVTGSVTQRYDSNLWISALTVAAGGQGTTINYSYDKDGLLTQAGALAITRNLTNGLISGTALGAVASTPSYNSFGELSADSASVAGSTVLDTRYRRDALGRITEQSDTIAGITMTSGYEYDAAGRLSSVNSPGQITTYQYDANGNRTHVNGLPVASYDAQDRMTSYGGTAYTYTANGERQTKNDGGAVTHYQYDVLGNLRSVVLPGDLTIDYIIDGRNRRIGKRINGTLTQGLLYQDQLRPVAELDGSGRIVSLFIYGTRSNIPDYMVRNGLTYRILSDHLGSPRLIINSSDGSIAQRIDYDPWGTITNDSNPGFQPFGFAGGIYDYHTGLIRFGARDYDPQTGRWTAKDPIGFGGGDVNLYGYVLNDPVNYIDSIGLWSIGFEAYTGLGGGVTFGIDDNTGQPFLTMRIGYGLGGGLDYTPFSKRPGSDPCDISSGEAVGLYGKTGGRIGPIKVGLGFVAGMENGASPYLINPYGSFAGPKISFTNRGASVALGASTGIEFTIFGRGI
ncbi:MAG: hypothetical protein HY940_05485 [Gammaproteobacteria bacterium]|nr:hypothetical protein [Gammaproteobacteria bacterium]